MRIFFTGAQGTGKSTLVKELAKRHPELTVHDSMSKIFMKGDKNNQLTSDFQKRISLYCLNLYVNDRDFISSRSYFDSIAYPTYHVNQNIDNQTILDMVRLYEDLMFEDDCIYFYLPIEFEISEGNNLLRITDKEYQQSIDRIIKNEIEYINTIHPGKVITLHGSVEERLREIENHLSKL